MIWTSTSAELDTFITNPIAVHLNLLVNVQPNQLISKGSTFPYDNILDINTFQKPLNYTNIYIFHPTTPQKCLKPSSKGNALGLHEQTQQRRDTLQQFICLKWDYVSEAIQQQRLTKQPVPSNMIDNNII